MNTHLVNDEALLAYIEGHLKPDDRARLERCLAESTELQVRLNSILLFQKQVRSTLTKARNVHAPDKLIWSNVKERITPHPRTYIPKMSFNMKLSGARTLPIILAIIVGIFLCSRINIHTISGNEAISVDVMTIVDSSYSMEALNGDRYILSIQLYKETSTELSSEKSGTKDDSYETVRFVNNTAMQTKYYGDDLFVMRDVGDNSTKYKVDIVKSGERFIASKNSLSSIAIDKEDNIYIIKELFISSDEDIKELISCSVSNSGITITVNPNRLSTNEENCTIKDKGIVTFDKTSPPKSTLEWKADRSEETGGGVGGGQ